MLDIMVIEKGDHDVHYPRSTLHRNAIQGSFALLKHENATIHVMQLGISIDDYQVCGLVKHFSLLD